MINYQNGKIYKIISYQTDKVYIGSTAQPLSARLGSHRRKLKSFKNGTYHYVSSFEILKYEDHKIILIENYPCNSREELLSRESHYIKITDCVNKKIEGRTQNQWREDNKDYIKERDRKYREENKDKIKQKQEKYKEWRRTVINCECGGKYQNANKAKHLATEKHKTQTQQKVYVKAKDN